MKKLTKLTLTLLIILFQLSIISAQVGINNDNSDPDASAMLDVKSTDKGMLVPRMDSTARNAILNPADGLLVYDSTTTTFWYYDELRWNEIRNGSQTVGIQHCSFQLNLGYQQSGDCLEERASLNIMPSTNNIALDGNFAYVIGGGSLKVIDIKNPSQLVESGSIATTSSARYIDVANNYAYIVDENQEAFNVIDVSDVNNLSIVGTLNFGTDPLDVVVSGNYAYVLDPGIGIIVIDVSDPMNPTQVNTFGLGGSANGITLAGNYLYVVDDNSNDLRIIDISNPLSLSLTGSLIVGDFPTAVAILEDYAYVVDSSSDDLKVINVSNPVSPTLSASLPIGDEPTSVAVAGNIVYVVDTNSDDIKAIDVSDPTTPSLKASLPIGTHPNVVVTDEFFAYVVDSGSEDLKSIGACNELLSVDGATGEIQSTSIEEITAIATLVDSDEDTKIQLEESEDEDIIRFDIAGEEKWRMENNALIPSNIGNGIFIGENAGASDSLLFDEGFGTLRTTDNIFIGISAGLNNTTGINNAAIGGRSLLNNMTGNSNVAIGVSALRKNTSGSSNIAIGGASLWQNEEGYGNVVIGARAGQTILNGYRNVAIGDDAMRQQRNGSHNVAIGMDAGTGNIPHDKSNSTYIGYNAGWLNQGDENVFIGSKVASSVDWVDVDSTLAIDIEGTTSPLVYGEFNNDLVRINGDLEVTGDFPGSDDQSLILSNDTLYIEDGNAVDLNLADNQVLFLINDNLSISSGNTVDLSVIDTDDQTLAFDGTNLSIADGNSVDISSINSVQNIIEDGDGDTKIEVDRGNGDFDEINIDLAGSESFRIMRGNITFLNSAGNIYIGDEAGKADNFTGGSNIGIGANALANNASGSRNTAIGTGADVNSSNLTNATAIGALATVNQSNALVLGNNADVGIGTSTPDEKLHVVGNIKMEDGNEQAGYVLTSDANGVGTWQTFESPNVLADADNNTKIQVEESTNEDIIRFDLNGTEVLRINKNINGVTQMQFPNSGANSTVYGEFAGDSLSTGQDNTFIGKFAGRVTSTGRSNTFLGRSAGINNTIGNSNVFLGVNSGFRNSNGSSNVSVGRATGYDNVAGNNNTFLGHEAGFRNTGSGNLFLGSNAGYFETGSNKLFIDNSNTSNPLMYGEFDNDLIRINGDLEVTGSFPNTDEQTLTYNNTNKSLSISNGNTADLTDLAVPVGTIIMWIGDENETVPTGWLVCDNRLYNTTTYPDLFALLGTDRTPNFLGRFPVGAPRDGINGATGISVGGTGGEEDKTLSVANLPPHSHEIKFREGRENGGDSSYSDINGGNQVTGSTESTGSGTSFKIMPPFLGVQFLIKAE